MASPKFDQPWRFRDKMSRMAKCPKCGEALLGAVNRCWKCGETFTVPPDKPPAAFADVHQPMDAVVLDSSDAAAPMATAILVGGSPFRTSAPVRWDAAAPRMPTTAELTEARRAGLT